jgi:hypothetical protein
MRKIKPIFEGQSPTFQLFIFIFLLLFGALFGMSAGFALLYILPGIDVIHLQDTNHLLYLQAARIVQISSQFGLFIFPPVAWVYLFTRNRRHALGWTSEFNHQLILPAILLMFAALPLIHWLSEVNHSIHFPASLSELEQWLKEKEADAEKLTSLFLNVSTIEALLINLFMIAIIPAIGEELVFRSVLQPILVKLFRNAHLGIIIGSLLFSLLHFQFYGLLPRFILGLFLGYLYYWSGSIVIPMIMHFVNNGAAVLVFYLHANDIIEIPMKDFGSVSNPLYLATSIIITIAILAICKRAGNVKIRIFQ